MSKHSLRPIPTLIALPIPTLQKAAVKRVSGRLANKPRLEASSDNTNMSIGHKAITESMDSLRTVIELTLSFIAEGPSYVSDTSEWLNQLKQDLDELDDGLAKGWLDGHVTIETDGVSSVDGTLDSAPDIDALDDESVDVVAIRSLAFWLNEIQRRGRELVNICIAAVDVVSANNSFKTMRTMRYPISR